MTREQFHRLEELVDAAARLPAGPVREEWLRAHCPDTLLRAEVDALLDEELPDNFLAPVRLGLDICPAEPQPGDFVGPWKLESRVRRGGMGTVYRATRADGLFQRDVAVKVLHELVDDDGLSARFHRESDLLGRLSHPYIVRLLDAGATGAGVPWLAMEFADGVACSQWAAAREEGAVLRLFLRICEAVQTAHAQLVVHRDLKPSNILVNETGEPRVLDFGEARLLEGLTATDRTRTGLRGFTLNYASPAQILGQVPSTADDIYSLGVVLFEMLTRRLPRDLSGLGLPELVQYAQRGGTPLETAGLAPDLAAIAGKAMAHDAGARYGSVESLAADVQRYLRKFPVEARAPGWSYRVAKFGARHSLAIAGAALLAAVLGAGAVVILRASAEARAAAAESTRLREVAEEQARLARQQQQQAEEAAARERAALHVAARNAAAAEAGQRAAAARFNDVRALAGALIYKLEPEAAKIPGSTVFRKQLIDQATAYLDKLSQSLRGEPGDAEVWAEVSEAWNRLGRVQGDRTQTYSLGDVEGSLASYRKALAAQESRARLLPAGDREARRRVEDTRITLAAQLLQAGRKAEATRQFAQADSALAAMLRAQRDDATLRTYARRRFYDDMAGYLSISEELLARHPDDAQTLRNAALGHKYMAGVRTTAPADALTHAQRALEIDQRRLQRDPANQEIQFDVSFDWSMVGSTLARLDRDAEAVAAFRETVELRRKLMAADPANIRFRERLAAALNLLAYQLYVLRDYVAARPAFAEALTLAATVGGKLPPGTQEAIEAAALGGLAVVGRATGGTDACENATRARQLLQAVGADLAPLPALRLPIEQLAAVCGKTSAP